MSHNILVIDPDIEALQFMQECLEDAGYEISTTDDDSHALGLISSKTPELVVVDVAVLESSKASLINYLRANPKTEQVGILLLTNSPQPEADFARFEGLDGFVTKPLEPESFTGQVENILKRRGQKKTVISSGSSELDSRMGGGVPRGSLALIEGGSGAGKSVLSQQIVWGSLMDGYTVSIFTSENTVKSLVTQMDSLSLDVLDFLLLGKLRIYPMELSQLGRMAPFFLLEAMLNSKDRDIIIIDSLTLAIAHSSIEDILNFFEQTKRLCATGMTIGIIVHSHAIDDELLVRIRSMCDVHLLLRAKQDGQRMVKTLEVAKVRGAGGITGSIVAFEVEPGWGMRVIPISKARG